MQSETGTVLEVHLDGSAWIRCPARICPQAGQYLAAWNPASSLDPLPHLLFPGGLNWTVDLEESQPTHPGHTLRFAPPFPAWEVGTQLQLRGPLGQGFHLPRSLFLCNAFGVDSVGVGADNYYYLKRLRLVWYIRETLATTQAVWDVYVAHPMPVLGEPEPIFAMK